MYRAESGRVVIAVIAVAMAVSLVVALWGREWLLVTASAGTLGLALARLWGPRRTPTSSS